MANMQEIAEGLQILMKYTDPNNYRENSCAAYHEIFYASRVEKDRVSAEDRAKLEELGWHWSTDGDGWARFT